ncbi:hypothetical protein ACH34W_29920 [Actinomadura sp. 6N118]
MTRQLVAIPDDVDPADDPQQTVPLPDRVDAQASVKEESAAGVAGR